MRDILIIFCILLVLLIIISTLGGSIRPVQEPFQRPMGPEWFMNPAEVQHFTEAAVAQEEQAIVGAEAFMNNSTVYQESAAPVGAEAFMNNGAVYQESVKPEAFMNSANGAPSGFDGADSFASF